MHVIRTDAALIEILQLKSIKDVFVAPLKFQIKIYDISKKKYGQLKKKKKSQNFCSL